MLYTEEGNFNTLTLRRNRFPKLRSDALGTEISILGESFFKVHRGGGAKASSPRVILSENKSERVTYTLRLSTKIYWTYTLVNELCFRYEV